MKNVVVSMQNTLLAEAVAGALQKTGEFRVEQVLPGRPGDALSLCASAKADILLMEVSRLSGYTHIRRETVEVCLEVYLQLLCRRAAG